MRTFILLFAVVTSGRAVANDVELNAIKRLATLLKPIPPYSRSELGVRSAVSSRLEQLIQPIVRLSGPRGDEFDSYGQFLMIPVSMGAALDSHARLSNAVVDDLAAIGDAIVNYRLPTYVDPGGTPLPADVQLRVDAIDVLDRGFYLFRNDLRALRSYLTAPLRDPRGRGDRPRVIAPHGLNGLMEHSPRARAFVANVVLQYEAALHAYDRDIARFVDRVVAVDAKSAEIRSLRASMADLQARMDHMRHSAEFLVRTIVETLPIMVETSRRPLAAASDLEARVDALGRGLAASMKRARELLPRVSTSHHLMYAHDQIDEQGDEVLLARIERDLHWLFSGGGWHISNLSLPISMLGPDGSGGITFYQRTLIFRYVLVVATEINRLGRPPLTRRLLGWVGGGPKSVDLPAVAIRQTEDELWRRFFHVARLDEGVLCTNWLAPPEQ